jgi:hypothetical protein
MDTMDTMDPMDFRCGGVEIHGIHVRRSRRDPEEPAPSEETADPLRSEILSHADFQRQPLEPAQLARHARQKAKTATARTLSVPAVNSHGGVAGCAFLEFTDPYDDVVELIRAVARPALALEAAPPTSPRSTPSGTRKRGRRSPPRNSATSSPPKRPIRR